MSASLPSSTASSGLMELGASSGVAVVLESVVVETEVISRAHLHRIPPSAVVTLVVGGQKAFSRKIPLPPVLNRTRNTGYVAWRSSIRFWQPEGGQPTATSMSKTELHNLVACCPNTGASPHCCCCCCLCLKTPLLSSVAVPLQ